MLDAILKKFTSKNLTVYGVLVILAALAAGAAALFDGDPATNPNWEAIVLAITTGWTAIMAKGAASTGGVVPETPEAAKRVEG